MRPAPISEEQKANSLIGHLDEVVREKVKRMTEDTGKDCSQVVSYLRGYFESL